MKPLVLFCWAACWAWPLLGASATHAVQPPAAGVLTPVQPVPQTQPSEGQWYDARELEIDGKAWSDTEAFYDRLPGQAKEVVTPAVWRLSRHTAGLCVRFATDAAHISARWTLTSKPGHAAYARHRRQWR